MSGTDLGFVHVFEPASTPEAITLLLLHGTGGNERDLLGLGRTLAPDAALLSPRGRVLEGTMPRFFRRLAEGVFDLEDLERRTHELAAFVTAASQRYNFNPEQVTAVGFSNGANIAASLLLLTPETLSGAILFRAMVPLVPAVLPSLNGRAVLLSNGKTDSLVSPAETERLAALLRSTGADLTLAWQPGGHQLSPNDLEQARDWLRSTASRR